MSKQLVIITGASSGIGWETARLLAANGYSVIACARSDGKTQTGYDDISYVRCDITKQDDIDRLSAHVERYVADHGPLQSLALVNNAAIAPVGPIETVSKDEFDDVFLTNVYAPMRLIQVLLPHMKKVPSRIVNVSSGAGVLAVPLHGVYSMSKFAVEALSDVLRIELRQFNIKTVVVQPGLIDSAIHDKNLSSKDELVSNMEPSCKESYQAKLDHYIAQQQAGLKSAAKPAEVSKVIRKALEVEQPAARYGAGKDAKMLRKIHWLLTDRIRDVIMARMGNW